MAGRKYSFVSGALSVGDDKKSHPDDRKNMLERHFFLIDFLVYVYVYDILLSKNKGEQKFCCCRVITKKNLNRTERRKRSYIYFWPKGCQCEYFLRLLMVNGLIQQNH